LEFHNQHRDYDSLADTPADTYELLRGNKKFYSTVEPSERYVESWICDHSPGKVVLDYACGDGAYALLAAKSGAELAIGLDVSDVSIRNGRRAADRQGVASKTAFIQGDCEATGLPDASVDVIVCSGMLHHLDLSYAFPELRRILKPGGKIICSEALDYNPIIKWYRLRTPAMRTEWEKNHILSKKDLRFAQRFFELGEVRYWHLAAPLAGFVGNEATRDRLLSRAQRLDAVLERLPGVRLLSWMFTFELIGVADDKIDLR